MPTPKLIVMVLLAASFICIGAAWLFTVLAHAKVIRSGALKDVSKFSRWSQVVRAYPAAYPSGRLLFWRSLFQTLGLCLFIAMATTLFVWAMASNNR